MLNETDEILNVATSTKANTEKLLPLLTLLDETPGETSPIDELKGLLQAIVEILGHHTDALQRLESASVTAPPRDA